MNEPKTTLVGNLVAEPELRYTSNGAAVVNLTIAQTPKVKDQSGQWVDGEALFARCTAWRDLAEHISESLTKGTRVIADVRIKSRSYDTKEGEKRTVTEYEIDAMGPDLRYATAKVTKAERKQAGYTGHQRNDGSWTPNRESAFNTATGQGGFGRQQGSDPWATQASGQGGSFDTDAIQF